MSKKINIDFYKVELPNSGTKSFEVILQEVMQLQIKDRFREIRFYPVCIHEAQHNLLYGWEGNMIRLRMNNLPVKGSKSGRIEDIVFNEDEGIGEQTAFIYNPLTRVLALQSNQAGVSASTFAKYFEEMAAFDEPIGIDPILNPDAMKRLAKVKTVSKFEIRVAGLDNMERFETDDCGVREMIELTNAFQSPTISLNLSVGGKKRDSLSVEPVIRAAQALLGRANQNQQQVKTLRISGCTDEDESVYIDLLKDRMREIIEVNSGKKRNFPYYERKQFLQDAWSRRKQELFSMFNPK